MRVVVYGSRPDGHARVVLELLAGDGRFEPLGLIDDEPQNAGRRIGDLAVIGTRADLPRLAADGVEGVLLGFGAAIGRLAVIRAVREAGLELPALVHHSAQIASSARTAPGCQILQNAIVGPGARIGAGVLVNTAAIVEHDAQVGDAAVLADGALLAGRAKVGESAHIGLRAVLLPDVVVGAHAVVGAGAVVTADVDAAQTVVGVPARPTAGRPVSP